MSARFGDRLSVVSSGTAPLAPQVRDFMWSVFHNTFIGEGHGTQEVGLITLEGKIQKGVTVWLRDVEGYSGKDSKYTTLGGSRLSLTNFSVAKNTAKVKLQQTTVVLSNTKVCEGKPRAEAIQQTD